MNYKLKLRLISLLSVFVLKSINAQVEINKDFCGTGVPNQEWNNEFQRLVEQRKVDQSANKTQQALFSIPVIIHIIHGGQAVGTYPNLPQAQINSQILVLNNDYAGIGFNTGTYPTSAFINWASAQFLAQNNLDANSRVAIADCGVEFCLATKDTLGNILPEPGIDRISYVSRGWTDPGSFTLNANLQNYVNGTIKPQTIWNVTKYLNIWITDRNNNLSDGMGGGGILGYSTFPPVSGLQGIPSVGTSSTDGFWCCAKTFGSAATFPGNNNTYLAGYNRGRTSTHEIGHYLGLRHMWGDGNCANDYCNDTPPAATMNFGAPTYPHNVGSCTGNTPDGEMYMDFMDYTNDPVKYMFTTDQATRIQTAMTNSPYRKFLGTHGLCGSTAIASFANSVITCPGVNITLSNTSSGFPTPTYTWTSTGGVINPDPNAYSPTINFSTPGTYVVTLAAFNGTLSVISKTITVTSPQVLLSASSQTVCKGNSVSISASGSSSYTWEPGGTVSNVANYTPLQPQQSYTCNATQVNGCNTTTVISIFAEDCTGISQILNDQPKFNIYPNPANDFLNVAYFSGKSANVKIDVVDALGNIVLTENFSFSKDKQNQAINISLLPNGVYFVKLKTDDTTPQFLKLVKE